MEQRNDGKRCVRCLSVYQETRSKSASRRKVLASCLQPTPPRPLRLPQECKSSNYFYLRLFAHSVLHGIWEN
jgi:hypothetical protein